MQAGERGRLAEQYRVALSKHAPANARRITDKYPLNFMHLGFVATLFPRARVIHCRRDPLDIGLSCFIERFMLSRDFTTDLESFGYYFLECERLMAHWRNVLPLQIHAQYYERLVADQEAQSRVLVAHCGLDWNAACLDFQNAERTVLTPSRWQVRQAIYGISVGRWRNYARHMEPLPRLLEEHGYRYDGHAARP